MWRGWRRSWPLPRGPVVGFVTINPRSDAAAEIHVLGVPATHHGLGLGRALVAHAERIVVARGFEYLQVKTLGPSRPNAAYARTRGFYARMGFRPLEENRLWGDANPCLILVKHLRCSALDGTDRPGSLDP
jgi:GNAT superfamily N-acetyltransferase